MFIFLIVQVVLLLSIMVYLAINAAPNSNFAIKLSHMDRLLNQENIIATVVPFFVKENNGSMPTNINELQEKGYISKSFEKDTYFSEAPITFELINNYRELVIYSYFKNDKDALTYKTYYKNKNNSYSPECKFEPKLNLHKCSHTHFMFSLMDFNSTQNINGIPSNFLLPPVPADQNIYNPDLNLPPNQQNQQNQPKIIMNDTLPIASQKENILKVKDINVSSNNISNSNNISSPNNTKNISTNNVINDKNYNEVEKVKLIEKTRVIEKTKVSEKVNVENNISKQDSNKQDSNKQNLTNNIIKNINDLNTTNTKANTNNTNNTNTKANTNNTNIINNNTNNNVSIVKKD